VGFNRSSLKAAVFIDHSNIASPILGPNCKSSIRINYKKFKDLLLHGYKDKGVFMFMGVTDPIRPEKKDFMRYLDKIDYVVLTTPLVKRRDGTFEQKQLDIFMHEYMISKAEANEIDVAILVSGDADFVLTVMILQNMNKDVIVWSWRNSLSNQLRDTVGEGNVFYIDNIWERIRRKKGGV